MWHAGGGTDYYRAAPTTKGRSVSLALLVQQYGYIVVAIGTFFEGETVLVLGGLAAQLGYLELPWVIVSAFGGTVCGDQLYFFIGRHHGRAMLAKRPHWQRRAQRIFRILHRHQNLLLLGFRFLYGLRTITPFVVGMSEVSTMRFVLLNILSAAVWAIAVGVLGYVFGSAIETVLGDIKHYEVAILLSVAAAAAAAWGVSTWRRRRSEGAAAEHKKGGP